jgi:excisionase family DNA binding protein
MAETERFVKSEVAGRYLGLSALTIRRMAHQGKIPAYGLPCGVGCNVRILFEETGTVN